MINVYLISSEINGKVLYKIGITKRKIEDRIKEFRTGSASEFRIVDSFRSKWARKIEANLHRTFKQKRISGEWFDLCDSDLSSFKEKCETIHFNLDAIENGNTYYIDRGNRF